METTERPRLKDFALAAIADQLPADNHEPELVFLRSHLTRVTTDTLPWTEALQQSLSRPHPADILLLRLARTFPLTFVELLTIALAAAVEEDVQVGRAIARVQSPLGGSRPTLSLLSTSFQPLTKAPPISVVFNGSALACSLLRLGNTAAPLPEQTVSIPIHLYFALNNRDSAVEHTILGIQHLPSTALSASCLGKVEQYAKSLENNANQVLVIRSPAFAESRIVADRVAKQLNLRPLFLEGALPIGLAPWLQLRQLLPVFCPQLTPGEYHQIPVIGYYDGPVVAIAGPDGQLESQQRDLLSWSLSVPTVPERESLWTETLSDSDLAAILAKSYRYSSDRIAQLSRLAQHYSTLAQRDHPTEADIRAAAWSGEGIGLDGLAQPLTQQIPDEALVMPNSLRENLQMLLLRCQARDTLTDGLGVSTTACYYPGVKALFVGPSGTGKTLSAGWLATKLGMPLYRVDLAAIVSKYIGETEKNLAQLLARAESAGVILLFDEADSLFGKRTDVQQANDRFANSQTNYLLQRIESYDGITLLTSNSRQRFDSAFSRRLDFIVEFTLPRPTERRALWRSHLGDRSTLSTAQLNQLATAVDLCGGHIRNAVLMAAVLAQSQQREIDYADIIIGVNHEYHKLGRQMPALTQPSHV
ncbi:ATP-binding protein [cf. Phormidesmis sp. LEGE 11477]|uniref:ATP-binding protein n=1 Tax=cf. Phormidesmis sp. LEGE 11477 TaxID=1828680 RepID=UPI00188091EA|nr:AAA family ATPase [cf. Phormidesmis sp. LEGE 11477]MBE9064934.1 ATP-binding protein [cf. Phormidesmis sp. LEGE 11477]